MKRYRTLIDGRQVEEFPTSFTLAIRTKCPQKYQLIDKETGDVYEGHHPSNESGLSWKKVDA